MTRPASDRCAYVYTNGGSCGLRRQSHSYVHAFVESPPVTFTKETGEAAVREIAGRLFDRLWTGQGISKADFGVVVLEFAREAYAAGRASAFEEAADISLNHGAPHIARTIAARAKEGAE